MTLVYLSGAWIGGILLGPVIDLRLPFLLGGTAILLLTLRLRTRRRALVLLGVGLLLAAGGILRAQAGAPEANDDALMHYNDRGPVTIRGLVNGDPEMGEKTLEVPLKVREVMVEGDWQPATGTALLFVPSFATYAYGDVIEVTGRPQTPPSFQGFDYAAYLARRGIRSTLLYPQVTVLEAGQGLAPRAWLYSVRNRLAESLAASMPEPQASLAQAIVLGKRGGIPADLRSDFARSGTSHLLAISGLHLGIVAGLFIATGARLFGRQHHVYAWLALALIWLYVLLTGVQPPVVRAAIMASLFLAAEMLGRQRSAVTALGFAAAVMAGINPHILAEASFQLSFLAMLGLVLISPRLREYGSRLVKATLGEGGLIVAVVAHGADILAITLGVLLFVWPVIAYHFGIVSLVAPLATLLALPALPLLIATGALTAGLGALLLPIGQAAGWIAWLFTSYTLVVVRGAASFSWSSVETGAFDVRLVLGYYAFVAAALWLGSRKWRTPAAVTRLEARFSALPSRWVMLPLAATAILATSVVAALPDGGVHVSFLDIGQGDSILVQTGAGHDILIDGGPNPGALTRALGQKMPFWDRTIDLVVLTHPHADHLTGLIEVLRRYRVKQVLYADLEHESPAYHEWLGLIEEKAITVTAARAGQRIVAGGIVIDVLNPVRPSPSDTDADIDNRGIVLRVSAGQVSFLLTADVGVEAETELLMRRADLRSTVLKVGHHGSSTSSSPGFVATVDPQAVAISLAADNRFGHPDDDVMALLAQAVGQDNIYRTDEDGTIEFITDGNRLRVRTER